MDEVLARHIVNDFNTYFQIQSMDLSMELGSLPVMHVTGFASPELMEAIQMVGISPRPTDPKWPDDVVINDVIDLDESFQRLVNPPAPKRRRVRRRRVYTRADYEQ